MAELRVGAPLACEETEDDWNDFSDSKTTDFDAQCIQNHSNELNQEDSEDLSSIDCFLERGKSGSLEDLVQTFDRKLSDCFGNYEDNVSKIAPVQIRSQDDIISSCQTWLTLTGTYGTALPIDWSKCYIKELQTKSLKLLDKPLRADDTEENLDLSDDEELKEELDPHTIVSPMVPQHTEEINADEVIQELDTIMKMQDSMSTDDTGYITEPDMLVSTESDIDLKDISGYTNTTRLDMSQAELQSLTIKNLNDMVDELQNEIDLRSSILVSELASRDDIIYERELKNTFISLCHKVMKKQKPVDSKDKRRSRTTETVVYVIPYQLTQMPPSNELLHVYIKILKAIYENSPQVPAMLTDYILKVVCPTS